MRGIDSVMPPRWPNIETAAPARRSDRPSAPAMRRPASASGTGRFWRSARAQNALRHDLQGDVEKGDADHRQRDGARHGPFGGAGTSPLGINATSIPANAKARRSDMRAKSPAAGHSAT